jgi:hypothetical protein
MSAALQSLKSNSTLVALCAAALAVEEACAGADRSPHSTGGGWNDTMARFEDRRKNATRPGMLSSENWNATTEDPGATMAKICEIFAALIASRRMGVTDAGELLSLIFLLEVFILSSYLFFVTCLILLAVLIR